MRFSWIATIWSLALVAGVTSAPPAPALGAPMRVFYRSVEVDGLSIFYREAGDANAPTLLLLHGFPSSSRMFEPLLSRLSYHYHLIAPDYPGFGHSSAPDANAFEYTFDHIAEVTQHLVEQLGLNRYTLYMQDYGGPVGFRLALAHPERVQAFIVQNAVAHEDGLGALWDRRRAFWKDRAANEAAIRENRTPNLFALHYDPVAWAVVNVFVVPHFAFPFSAIEKRKPLGPTARRAGWVGCNILLDAIPADAKIRIIKSGAVLPSERVRRQYARVRPLANLNVEQRGWTLDVLNAVHSLGKERFSLTDVYTREEELAQMHPSNRHIRDKIRQQLQVLRDLGLLEFLGAGRYYLRRA